jgi:D-alanyl-lipoteichoic acid acyltransferase DltB (MBOAT superfamily)
MLIGGFWHGASFNFIIWGALHGVGLIVNKIWTALFGNFERRYIPRPVSTLFFGLLTFHFVCFCWIFFRAADLQIALQFIDQIRCHVTFTNYLSFLQNYKTALIMIVIGFLIHLVPDLWADKFIEKQKNYSLIYFIIVTVLFLFLYSYFKSAQSVMPIYLQF